MLLFVLPYTCNYNLFEFIFVFTATSYQYQLPASVQLLSNVPATSYSTVQTTKDKKYFIRTVVGVHPGTRGAHT